jgi:hypothetical protein
VAWVPFDAMPPTGAAGAIACAWSPVREPCSASRDDARRGRALLNGCTASGSIAGANELPPWFDLVRAGGKRLPRPCSRLASLDEKLPALSSSAAGLRVLRGRSTGNLRQITRPKRPRFAAALEHGSYAKPAAMRRACRAASFSP